MQLTSEESNLFFELMGALQFYVNTKFNFIKDINSLKEYKDIALEEKIEVRDYVYDTPDIIDEYIEKNPYNLSLEQLGIVEQWKNFVAGEFYIERYLKNYAIFIRDAKVYGVLSLHSSFDDIFPKYYLPVYVKTVLLPFKGKVIYDGVMQSYNIHFGGGIKRSIKESYMRAKQNNRIIFSLGETSALINNDKPVATTESVNWSKEINQLMAASKKLKGGSDQPIINGQIFSLLRGSVELANQAIQENADADVLLKELKKVKRSVSKIENTLYRYDD